jgi:hypothetical protein
MISYKSGNSLTISSPDADPLLKWTEIDNFATSKRLMTSLEARQVWNVVFQRPDSQF